MNPDQEFDDDAIQEYRHYYPGRPLIVGESNPYGGGDEFALYPHPDGCSGHRLCRFVMEMRRTKYLESFDRTNLVQGKWSMPVARKKAGELIPTHSKFILLGSKVCAAFSVEFKPFTETVTNGSQRMLVLPHPSGLCRLWNDPTAVRSARYSIGLLCPELIEHMGVHDAVSTRPRP